MPSIRAQAISRELLESLTRGEGDKIRTQYFAAMGVGVIHVFVNIILGWMVLIVFTGDREGRGSSGECSEQGNDTELHDETRGLLECNAKERCVCGAKE